MNVHQIRESQVHVQHVRTPQTLGQERVGGSPRLERPYLDLLLVSEIGFMTPPPSGPVPSSPFLPLPAASGFCQEGKSLD